MVLYNKIRTACLRFNGTNTTVTVTSPSAMQINTFTIDLEVFLNKNLNTGGNQTIYYTRSGAGSGLELRVGTSMNMLVVKNGVATIMNNTAKKLPVMKWCKLTVTYDSATGVCNIYKNGELFDTATSAQTFTHGDVIFGNTTGFFNGLLSYFRVFNRVLTAAEILALHERDIEPTGLVAKFKFDENTGTTVTDTVNSYTGTVANGTWTTQVATKARSTR